MDNKYDDLTPEGREEVERLRKKYVISEEDLRLHKEQKLLRTLYECQDMMADLLDEGKEDKHYFLIEILIKRLEDYLQNNQDLM